MHTTPKYSNWLGAALYNGLQKLSIPIFGVVSTMLLAHEGLTKPEMGVWSLFLVFTSFIELIRQALVKTSLIKFVNHAGEEDQKNVLSAAFFLNTAITSILTLVLIVAGQYFENVLSAPELGSMLYIFIAGMILLIPFSHFEWIMYGKSDFRGLFWIYFVRQGLNLLLIIGYLFFRSHVPLEILVLFYNCAILAGTIMGYRWASKHLLKVFVLKKEWLKLLWNFGKYVFGTGVSSLVLSNAAQIMLSPMLGSTTYTASQGIANRVINLADIPSQVLGDILYPKSSKQENAQNKGIIKYYYEKTVGAALCINIPVVLFMALFPKFIVLVLGGKQYLDAAPYLQLISVTGIFLTFLKYYGIITDSSGRPKLNFFTTTVIAIINIALTYFFILKFGFLGAAYAYIITHIIGFGITQVLLNKMFDINFINCFKYAVGFYPELTRLVLHKLKRK